MTPLAPNTVYLPNGPWATVLDALSAHFARVPRAVWQDRMRRGRVRSGADEPIDANTPYRAGMRVHYWREVIDEPSIASVEAIVHQDEHLLVADKPPFLPVVPAGRYVNETLLARLIRRTGNRELVPLHRIDRLTSGLVLFSTARASRGAYQALFRERRIEKRYEALAPALPTQVFPLVRRTRIVAGEPFFRMREVSGEANSETRIEVRARGAACWRYLLYPLGGRKHQLRVHMAALGAAIANDPLYPELAGAAPDDASRPLQLIAKALRFDDPLQGGERFFESPRELRQLTTFSPAAASPR
ncbi:MAG TPA: pseudouridine synthase [Rhodanobacteraceae bacterium]|nr:pseudouridine synthase [Rhodanobacteraceae bacterium]